MYTIRILSSFILFTSLLVGSLFAQNVKLKGNVFYKSDNLEDVKFSILQKDSVIQTLETSKNGKFKIEVERGKAYVIEITKDDFVPKTIILTTYVKEDTDLSVFEFDIALHKEKEFRYVDNTPLKEAVAHIFYNSLLGELDYDRSITEHSKNEYTSLKEENQKNRKAKYTQF